MKLHLPKTLLVAVMAVVAMAPSAQALSITGAGNLIDYTIDTRAENNSYNGFKFSYSGNSLTLHGSPSIFEATITLDYDAFTAADNSTDILYVNTTGAIWGFHKYNEGNYGDVISGKWQASGHHSTGATIMSATDFAALATGEGDNRVITGLKVTLESGGVGTKMTTAGGVDVFNCSGLTQGSKTFNSVAINTALVSSITTKDYEDMQISAGEVSTVLSRANTTILDGTGKYEISNVNDDRLANGEDADGNEVIKNIVVAGTSQLFLNAWGSSQTLVVDRDIYIGQTTFSEGEYSNAAIRFGNNGDHETDLDGTLYVIEDAILKSTGQERAINLNGGVTDIINGTAANSTLTFRGKGYNVYSDVNLGGLVVDSNSKVTFAGDSSLTIGSTIDNKGTLVLNGTLALRNDDLSGFDYQNVGNIEEVATNGLFDIGTKYILIKGNALDASSTTTTVSYNGQTYNIADGITLGGSKGYAVVESDKAVTLGGSNATEGTADAALIYGNF